MTNMKKLIIGLLLVVAASSLLAVILFPFPGWNSIGKISPSIIIAKCKSSAKWTWVTNGVVHSMADGITLSDIEVVSVLKGGSVPPGTKATLASQYWACQGETYLLFATDFDGSMCHAIEDYRVVPLGHGFPTNILTGKPLDEQIKVILQYRYALLTNEMSHAQTEKQRLEEFLKK
jgi:hypothetical protein